jgi:hypothetical protein
MYFLIVGSLMFVLPIVSVIVEMSTDGHGAIATSIQKWFVFWAVGMRLLMAGVRQVIQPSFTAEKILGITDPDALLVVRELGFANTAIGAVGVISILAQSWILPASILGAIFYTLAGINHVFHKQRNAMENVAMTSDLFVAAVLLACTVKPLFAQHGAP